MNFNPNADENGSNDSNQFFSDQTTHSSGFSGNEQPKTSEKDSENCNSSNPAGQNFNGSNFRGSNPGGFQRNRNFQSGQSPMGQIVNISPKFSLSNFILKLFAVFLLIPFIGTILLLFCLMMLAIAVSSVGNNLISENGEQVQEKVFEKRISGDKNASHKIVILPIEGVIQGEEDGFIRQSIRQLSEDESVSALVLRINSPGGTMTGADYYHHLLSDLKTERKLPVIVSMGDMAASGGYYLSMLGDKIYAERSSMTGSIGVIISMYDASELCAKIGVHSAPIVSGGMKGMGDFTKPMAPEEKEIWQNLVNESYQQFLEVVVAGRPNFQDAEGETSKLDELKTLADGRVYSAKQALDAGLIDELGFLDDAVMEALERIGLDKDSPDVQVVRYESPVDFMSELFGVNTSEKSLDSALKSVSEASSPRIYMLCPRLIPLIPDGKKL